jgi:uncharacterized protein YdeI (YjbR/CyaY-like superfamily)
MIGIDSDPDGLGDRLIQLDSDPIIRPMPVKTPSFTPDLPVKLFKDQHAWERWLDANHAKSQGLWLRIAKTKGPLTSVSYAAAVESALCYGWIDGQKRPYDESSWLQRFTPRRARSPWSKVNTAKAQALIESGRMKPAGLAEVERARADGRWESAYAPASSATVPPDLQAALDANPKAKAFFATLRGSNRYAFIYRVQSAKRPETRARRVAESVAMLARGETYYSVMAAKQKAKRGAR